MVPVYPEPLHPGNKNKSQERLQSSISLALDNSTVRFLPSSSESPVNVSLTFCKRVLLITADHQQVHPAPTPGRAVPPRVVPMGTWSCDSYRCPFESDRASLLACLAAAQEWEPSSVHWYVLLDKRYWRLAFLVPHWGFRSPALLCWHRIHCHFSTEDSCSPAPTVPPYSEGVLCCSQHQFFLRVALSLVLEESWFLVGPFPSILSLGGSLVPLVYVDQSTADPPHARGHLTSGTHGASAQIWDINLSTCLGPPQQKGGTP